MYMRVHTHTVFKLRTFGFGHGHKMMIMPSQAKAYKKISHLKILWF